jgi:hypothetical protein
MIKQMAKAFGVTLALIVSVALLAAAATSPSQTLVAMRFINAGIQSQGAKVLQTGEMNTLSASVATATLTQAVAAPSLGLCVYPRRAGGEIDGRGRDVHDSDGHRFELRHGHDSVAGPGDEPACSDSTGWRVLAPATKAVCVQTDAATTLVRALT